VTPVPVETEILVQPGEAVTATLGGITINLPIGSVTEPVTLTVSSLSSETAPPATGGYSFQGNVIEITAGDTVTFSEFITLTFTCDPCSQGMQVMWYDEDNLVWVSLETTVDIDRGVVYAFVDHLTKFALLKREEGGFNLYLPLMQR